VADMISMAQPGRSPCLSAGMARESLRNRGISP
jgi:hypothetical protein